MQLTRTSEKLNRTILFNAERGEIPFSAPADSGHFSLILLRDGHGNITIRLRDGGEATFPMQSPVAVCLRNGESVIETPEACDVYNVVFSPTFINVNMKLNLLSEEVYRHLSAVHYLFSLAPFMETHAELKCLYMTEDQMAAYFSFCDTAVRDMEEEDPDNFWSCRIRASLMDILAGLETQYAHRRLAMEDDSVTFLTYRNMVMRIHADLSRPCRIEDICREFGMNKNKLQRVFRTYSGLSYHDFIMKARLERAQSYLAFTELQLNEIAHRLGFSTEQHFYRFFRRETNISPYDFRHTAVAARKEAFACLNLPDRVDPGSYNGFDPQ